MTPAVFPDWQQYAMGRGVGTPLAPPSRPLAELVTAATEAGWLRDGQEEAERAMRACRVLGAFRGAGLSDMQERAVLVNLIAAAQDDARSWTKRLVDGLRAPVAAAGGLLSRWFRGMVSALVPRHYAASMVLVGSLSLAPADKVAARDLINDQGGYLARWRTQIRTGQHVLGPASVARSAQYGSSIWQVAHNVRLAEAVRDGFAEARRVLGGSNHCETCKREAKRGWVPIATVLPLGDAECQSSCRCRLSFR